MKKSSLFSSLMKKIRMLLFDPRNFYHDDNGNQIHRTSQVMTKNIGCGNYIGPHTFIHENVRMGSKNFIDGFAHIGGLAEHKAANQKSFGSVVIGSHNRIGSFTTIDGGHEKPFTLIASNCMIMNKCHIAHDNEIEDGVILSAGVVLAGHVHIMKNAVLGIGALVHQRQVIGSYAMLGAGTVVPRVSAIFPFSKHVGVPAREIGQNTKHAHLFQTNEYFSEGERYKAMRRAYGQGAVDQHEDLKLMRWQEERGFTNL